MIRHRQIVLQLSVSADKHLTLVEECPQCHYWCRETPSIVDVVILDLGRGGQREGADVHFEVKSGDYQEIYITAI